MAYIKIEKAIAEIDKGDLLVGNNAEWAKEVLYRTPTADVVEVVRCSECVMHEKGCPLDTHPYMTPDDGYCYKGKRKDDA
jgi:hypothetical protein